MSQRRARGTLPQLSSFSALARLDVGSCRRWRSRRLIAASLARILDAMVRRLTTNLPPRVLSHACVKPGKLKVGGLPSPTAFSSPDRVTTELDHAGLIGMQFQVEPAEPLPQLFQEPLCVRLVLEADHEVVRVAHDDHVAVRPCLSPLTGSRAHGQSQLPLSAPQWRHLNA